MANEGTTGGVKRHSVVVAVLICASCGTDDRPAQRGEVTGTSTTTVSSTTTASSSTSPPSHAAALEPTVSATPQSGTPGGRVSLSVAGHCSDLRIGVYLETDAGTPDSPIIGEATTTSSGTATLDVLIPADTEVGRYRLGTFYIDAPDECRNRKAAVPFDVR